MTTEQALEFIHSIARFGSKPGLRRVKLLLERLDNPQDKLRFVHVAGTNGKGSTCTMLSNIFREAGLRTGLYISPFVLDFRERIQLNNGMISPEDLAACTETVKAHWDALDAMGETPTEFEVVVAVAMEYFVRKQCDIVVLEVGMGGRFDATNAIGTPLCSVITSIGMDHTEYLGDTLEKIAFEKCGIIKPGGITVSYPQQDPAALAVIMEQCALHENRLLQPVVGSAQVLEQDLSGSRVQVGEREFFVPLAGQHQVYNMLTVLETVEAVKLAGLAIPEDAVACGIAAARFPSRLEVLGRNPLVLLDGAHNLSGAQALAGALALLGGRRVHAVAGMLADKDVDGILGEILPRCASLAAVTPPSPRALDAAALAEHAERVCPCITCHGADLRGAVQAALGRCEGDDAVLFFGSLYLASALRPVALELLEKRGVSGA